MKILVFICIKIRICGSNQLLELKWFTLVTFSVLTFSWLKKKIKIRYLQMLTCYLVHFILNLTDLYEILNVKNIIFNLFFLKKHKQIVSASIILGRYFLTLRTVRHC